ncbi:hypothetical protein RQP46_009726 [Phenoliferia psychrophenolica]
MRFHILGAGSIGSLLAANLAELPNTTVRLMVRRKEHLKKLLALGDSSPRAPSSDSGGVGGLASVRIESQGLSRRTDGLEIELLASAEDKRLAQKSAYRLTNLGTSGASDRALDMTRQDPIETLIITTKANQTLPALRDIVPRLSSTSTVVLCQNGMGTLERILDRYWPDDDRASSASSVASSARDPYGGQAGTSGGRPSFVCATTSHGMWRKDDGVYVHAGRGDIKFGVVPNSAVLASLSSTTDAHSNPLINPRSLTIPSLSHLPPSLETLSLRNTVSALLSAADLRAQWLPLPTLQIAQLQKLCVNTSVNALTATMGVLNGALVGSPHARAVIESVAAECALVYAAHLAREEAPSLASYTFTVLFKTSANVSSTLADIISTSPILSPSLPSPSSPTRTEVDFMHGYVEALGRRYGIPTPVTSTLGTLVKLKEEMIRRVHKLN